MEIYRTCKIPFFLTVLLLLAVLWIPICMNADPPEGKNDPMTYKKVKKNLF